MSLLYKQKMYVSGCLLIVLLVLTFGYIFNIFKTSNETLAEEVASLRKEYQGLHAEQERFQQGKKEIEAISEMPYQPDLFFSTDTRLVKEIATFESLARSNNLEMSLAVSGTIEKSKKVESLSGDVYEIPYAVMLKGTFGDIQKFLSSTERTSFVTHVAGVSMIAGQNGELDATINGVFFLKKQ